MFEQFVKMPVFCHLGLLVAFSAVILAGLYEYVGHGAVVVDCKIERAVGIPAADVYGRGELVAEGDPHVDAVVVLGQKHVLHVGSGQLFARGDEDPGDRYTPVQRPQVCLVKVDQRSTAKPPRGQRVHRLYPGDRLVGEACPFEVELDLVQGDVAVLQYHDALHGAGYQFVSLELAFGIADLRQGERDLVGLAILRDQLGFCRFDILAHQVGEEREQDTQAEDQVCGLLVVQYQVEEDRQPRTYQKLYENSHLLYLFAHVGHISSCNASLR